MSENNFGEELGEVAAGPDARRNVRADHATRTPNQNSPARLDRRRCRSCGDRHYLDRCTGWRESRHLSGSDRIR